VIVWLQRIVPLPAQEPAAGPTDWFGGEPKRPRADAAIRFSRSWDDARVEARRSGRRLMAYFTSDWCRWCRALEKRTFTDAEVVALASQFVCVEINTSLDSHGTGIC
jgi:thiol:disulfide interchange protein